MSGTSLDGVDLVYAAFNREQELANGLIPSNIAKQLQFSDTLLDQLHESGNLLQVLNSLSWTMI